MDPLSSFRERFGAPRGLVGMLHVGPLPGTPAARDSIDLLIEQTVAEARIYRDAGLAALAWRTCTTDHIRRAGSVRIPRAHETAKAADKQF
jgi:hypothetical protein